MFQTGECIRSEGESGNSVHTFPPLRVLRAFTAVYAPVPGTSVKPAHSEPKSSTIGNKGD